MPISAGPGLSGAQTFETVAAVDVVEAALAAHLADSTIVHGITDTANVVSAYSPLGYGAVGNDSTDDSAALQACITAAASAGVAVDLRGKTYKTTVALGLPAGSYLTNGSIHCTGTGQKILDITGSNVTVRQVDIIGRHATATSSTNEYGIRATGASAAAPLTNIVLNQVSVTLTGAYGFSLKWVDGFDIIDCHLTDLGFCGVQGLSVLNGTISGNRIDNVLLIGGNGYGIILTRDAAVDSLVDHPCCADVVIRGNIVTGIDWEGIDTHGGDRITISDNVVTNCETGISVGPASGATGELYAPHQISVSDNIIDSSLTDGTRGPGILYAGAVGASASAAATDYATGLIVGNVVKGHGGQSNFNSGAVFMRNTRGVTVAANNIQEPSPFAVQLYYDNREVNITGNTVIDAWATAANIPGVVGATSTNNTGSIVGNTLVRGDKTATYVNDCAVRSPSPADGNALVVAGNSFTAATTTLSNTAAILAGFYGTDPVTKQTGVAVSAAGVHAALVNLGLIGA
jgi:hypothetical protein